PASQTWSPFPFPPGPLLSTPQPPFLFFFISYLHIFVYTLLITKEAMGTMELSGILGRSVTFPLEIPAAEQFENAAWTVNTNSLVTVTPGKPPNVVLIDKTNYRGRLEILDESYSLQITHLRMEDTGQYRAAVNTDKGSVTKRFTLRVSSLYPFLLQLASLPRILCREGKGSPVLVFLHD
uniref:Immunoglobulin domain-containing protein n=1 Tax=Chrysemys picta bellii TaxID=8478 RepID=A0A8C3FM68_CHRPI